MTMPLPCPFCGGEDIEAIPARLCQITLALCGERSESATSNLLCSTAAKERTMVYHLQKRWRLKFRHDPDAGRVLFIGPLVVSLDVRRHNPSVRLGCAEDGNARKDPRGCWNVRCQLGKRCCRDAA